jgi:predicted transcriptional regulator
LPFSVSESFTAREVLFNDWRARQALKLSAPVFSLTKQEREMAARGNYARKKAKDVVTQRREKPPMMPGLP